MAVGEIGYNNVNDKYHENEILRMFHIANWFLEP